MSLKAHILKAKIEAVIYASEEPVTLAQLIGLLGQEAQAELDALQPSLALEGEATPADEGTPTDPGAPGPDSGTWVEAPTGPTPTNDADALSAEIPDSTADDKQAQREREAEAKQKAKRLRDYFRSVLDQLIADYATGDRGLEVREVAGGFRLATKPEYHDAVRGFVKSLKPPLKLSLQALETLAVVAYKQPVTAPEVSEIRGVDSAGVLGSLLTRKLVTTAGRKQVIGRPILYKTTKDFLVRFGLKDIAELPSIEEFEKMAGELNGELNPDELLGAVQQEIDMETPTDPGAPGPDSGTWVDESTEPAPAPTE